MINRKAFCTACICTVARDNDSPKAKIFNGSRRPSTQNAMLIGEDGRCCQCGKTGLVVYYMIPESTERAAQRPTEDDSAATSWTRWGV